MNTVGLMTDSLKIVQTVQGVPKPGFIGKYLTTDITTALTTLDISLCSRNDVPEDDVREDFLLNLIKGGTSLWIQTFGSPSMFERKRLH